MRHLDLFSGIGGFALAAQTVWGNKYRNVGFCDNEPFSQAILKKHWPDSILYDDIKKLLEPPPADIVTGGFPCQPFSAAGKRRGTADDRHLWPEMLRVIRASAPRWVIGENVGGLLTWDGGMVLDQVLTDLESAGYQAWPFVLPAAAVGAPHRRDRVWIVAHSTDTKRRSGSNGGRQKTLGTSGHNQPSGSDSTIADTDIGGIRRYQYPSIKKGATPCSSASGFAYNTKLPGLERHGPDKRPEGRQKTLGPDATPSWKCDWPSVAARLCTLDDGLPAGVVRPKGWRNAALKGAGNAIVPQVAIEIMRAIKEIDPFMV